MALAQNRIDKESRVEVPKAYLFNYLILGENILKYTLNKREPLQQMLGKMISTCKRIRLDPLTSPCRKTYSKCINDNHMNPDTLKLLKGKAGDRLHL